MGSLNQVHIIGRLGRDPETRQFEGGSVCNFSLATDESYKNRSGEMQEMTEWHNCSAWNKTGEVVQRYLHKGDIVHVQGKLATRQYQKDGVTHKATEVRVERVTLMGKGGGSGEDVHRDAAPARAARPSATQIDDPMDDIPF